MQPLTLSLISTGFTQSKSQLSSELHRAKFFKRPQSTVKAYDSQK